MSCNLGSINLSAFVENPYTTNARFNFNEFARVVTLAVRSLDDIVDENMPNHPLQAQRDNAKNYRNIGLGVFGYANALFEMGMTYGGEEALIFTKYIFRLMLITALAESNKLAKEKGAFLKCKPEKIVEANILKDILIQYPELKANILEYGLRNCSLLSVAPTGTIATTLLGLSGGCEPEFALKYTRHTDNLNDAYTVYSKAVRDYWAVNGECDYNDLPSFFVTSKDIKWQDRIDIQAIMQNYVDTAISSTINLPKETTKEEIEQLYLRAWKKGLKGVTLFRDGCERRGILTTENSQPSTSQPQPPKDFRRGDIICVTDDLVGYKRKVTTGCGDFQLQLFFDDVTGKPLESYISMGDGGGCAKNLEALSRTISLSLRGGIDVSEVIKQLKKVPPCLAYCNRQKKYGDCSKGTSCSSAIGYALEELNEKIQDRCFADSEWEETEDSIAEKNIQPPQIQDTTDNKCPECGAKLRHENGCIVCYNCGWNKC